MECSIFGVLVGPRSGQLPYGMKGLVPIGFRWYMFQALWVRHEGSDVLGFGMRGLRA